MKKIIPLIFIYFSSCQYFEKTQSSRLRGKIEALRQNADFKPLKSIDAYDFVNKSYVLRLDTMPTKRRTFINPLTGIDYRAKFKIGKIRLEEEESGDTLQLKAPKNILNPPDPITFNEGYNWESKRLNHVEIVKDDEMIAASKHSNRSSIDSIDAWHKKFGYGYMCISYPLYNSHTNKLVIREWLENRDRCGTGREKILWYTKTVKGWQAE